jgi:hypothetical protein
MVKKRRIQNLERPKFEKPSPKSPKFEKPIFWILKILRGNKKLLNLCHQNLFNCVLVISGRCILRSQKTLLLSKLLPKLLSKLLPKLQPELLSKLLSKLQPELQSNLVLLVLP